ncbi:MAG: hypothetical protein BWY52_02675 [Chloroflexi bacterium ADurb.Bin325]|nr:MAG: hypothetical protein BWY52_02675 [Chloroflexi bacterium ADurb.Bin325]
MARAGGRGRTDEGGRVCAAARRDPRDRAGPAGAGGGLARPGQRRGGALVPRADLSRLRRVRRGAARICLHPRRPARARRAGCGRGAARPGVDARRRAGPGLPRPQHPGGRCLHRARRAPRDARPARPLRRAGGGRGARTPPAAAERRPRPAGFPAGPDGRLWLAGRGPRPAGRQPSGQQPMAARDALGAGHAAFHSLARQHDLERPAPDACAARRGGVAQRPAAAAPRPAGGTRPAGSSRLVSAGRSGGRVQGDRP